MSILKINPDTQIGDTGVALKDICLNAAGTLLYDNPSGTTGNVQLNDKYTNYKYLDIYFKESWTGTQFSMRISTDIAYFTANCNVSRSGYNGFMSMAKQYYLNNNNTIYTNQYAEFIGIYFNFYNANHSWENSTDYISIIKVVGYKN